MKIVFPLFLCFILCVGIQAFTYKLINLLIIIFISFRRIKVHNHNSNQINQMSIQKLGYYSFFSIYFIVKYLSLHCNGFQSPLKMIKIRNVLENIIFKIFDMIIYDFKIK